ncbi:MAG: sirohydrochlorin chelatase [Pseudomonadota bacterium]
MGVMVCGHGSRSKAAVDEFAVVAERLKAHFPDWPVEYGYLEFANPVIRDGLDKLRAAGVERILAVPGMLFAAAHAKNDIPSVLNTYQQKHGLRVDYGRELAVDLKMIRAAGERIQTALDRANDAHGQLPNHEVCLVVIGRGASDPDANSNVSKIARMLWEGMGFGWCEVGYSGVTFPLVEPCLEHVARLGYRRVVVFPYFLFTGILVDRIYGFTDRVAAAHPHIQFVKAGYLNDHPLVVETFADRVREILEGSNLMNCAMCKYRAQVLGFEHEVGTPQESHHHHVEGKGASAPGSSVEDCPLCDTFCTGACRVVGHSHGEHGHHHHGAGDDHGHGHDHHHHDHDHDHGHDHHHHHHAPYPHADHPLGPKSVLKDRTKG